MASQPTKTSIERRMREARRLGRREFLVRHANGRGSDNWYIDHDGVQYDIKALWAAAHRPAITPTSFQTYDAVVGFKRLGYQSVKGIAIPHGLPDDTHPLPPIVPPSDDDLIRALHDPLPSTKHYKPTGYWLFLVNPKRWDAARWRATGEGELLYLVSKDDRLKMQPGDLGLIRVNRQRGAPATLIAAVEVLATPTLLAEPDTRFFKNPADGASALRARLAVITEPDRSVSAAAFPEEPAFQYVHDATQRTTIPIERHVFVSIATTLGLTGPDLVALRASRTAAGVRALETEVAAATPTRKERVSTVIERGSVGQAVKAAHRGRCQICVALGNKGRAFTKLDGTVYAEAHHVIPVSTLRTGVLSHLNIMVLCPNHHRQAHYGRFAIARDKADHWIIALDGTLLRIAKTRL